MSLSRGLIIYDGNPLVPQFRDRAMAEMDVTPPVDDLWYDVFDPDIASDLRGLFLTVRQSNGGASDEDLDVRVTADGTVYQGSFTATSGVVYYMYLDTYNQLNIVDDTVIREMKYMEPWYAQTMRIRIRQTSAVGAGATLRGRCRYEQL